MAAFGDSLVVPKGDRRDDQVEAAGSVALVLEGPVADLLKGDHDTALANLGSSPKTDI